MVVNAFVSNLFAMSTSNIKMIFIKFSKQEFNNCFHNIFLAQEFKCKKILYKNY